MIWFSLLPEISTWSFASDLFKRLIIVFFAQENLENTVEFNEKKRFADVTDNHFWNSVDYSYRKHH